MTNFIPIFPLQIVVFPGEALNLHIFEPRYRQLITECIELKKRFGIPTVLKGNTSDFGTTIEILHIEKVHDNGNMDIRTIGCDVFRILEPIHSLPDKLYSGAIVTYPENNRKGISKKMTQLLKELRYLHTLLDISKTYNKSDEELEVYDIAHHAGLSLEQEYELLQLTREDQRQEYLERHLKHLIPTILNLQTVKDRIKLNGHFRKLSVEGDNNSI